MRKVKVTYTASSTVVLNLSSYPDMTEAEIKEYEEEQGEADVLEVIANQEGVVTKVEVEFFDE